MAVGAQVTSCCSGAEALRNSKITEDIPEVDEETPTTAAPDSEEDIERRNFAEDEPDSVTEEEDHGSAPLGPGPPPPLPSDVSEGSHEGRSLGPGPPPPAPSSSSASEAQARPPAAAMPEAQAAGGKSCEESTGDKFSRKETLFIFDWDDTVLSSSWLQKEGLRLDRSSEVSLVQGKVLAELASVAGKTLHAAKQHGTVVLVTNAERGWIELSCQKFMPTLYPLLENVKMVSARTSYEGCTSASPLDWKLRAFDVEINRHFSSEVANDVMKRKNVLSLGDSVHEREAMLRATAALPNCRSKSLKFVERPDISQICKQHELIFGSFERIVHYDGNLDLCIRCP